MTKNKNKGKAILAGLAMFASAIQANVQGADIRYTTTDGGTRTVTVVHDTIGSLNLSGQQISSIFFPQVHFPKLETLDLSHNRLTGVIVPAGVLTSVKSIYLVSNVMTDLDEELLFSAFFFGNLERIHAGQNKLTSFVVPEGHQALLNLKQLSLSFNQLSNFVLPEEGLTNLERLDLRQNQLTSLTLPEGLSSLEWLDLSSNQLTSLTLPEGLTNLKTLRLYENQLTSLTLPEGLTSLEYLTLDYNQLTSLTLPEGLTSLEWLDLRQNQLTSLTLPEGLTNLKTLRLSGNPFMEIRLPVGFKNPIRFDVGRGLLERQLYRISYYDPLSVAPSSPKISISRGENGLEVSWKSGVLQKSAGVEGPWQDVNASSPLQVSPSLPAEFFRVRSKEQ